MGEGEGNRGGGGKGMGLAWRRELVAVEVKGGEEERRNLMRSDTQREAVGSQETFGDIWTKPDAVLKGI